MNKTNTPIHILYENDAWLPPLLDALGARGLSYELHFVDGGSFDLGSTPAEGIWINRMSPSSHTRGHQGGVQFVAELLGWLEAHGRRVINGSKAFSLELSKVKQDLALRAFDILTPQTLVVVGSERLKAAARELDLPFITKHNQGGKGLGVKLFRDLESFDAYVDGPDFVQDPGGITLLQQYIEPAQPHITRVELVGDELVMAIHSSTEAGFELCPAVECADDSAFCPVGGSGKFTEAEIDPDDPLVHRYVELMAAMRIDVAGIEFVTGKDGRRYTYDINGTTNYNADVEAAAGVSGMDHIAALAERLVGQATLLSAAK
jgi:glutathione synthase/RimK-type ligase-like ATP-grasp enzyme